MTWNDTDAEWAKTHGIKNDWHNEPPADEPNKPGWFLRDLSLSFLWAWAIFVTVVGVLVVLATIWNIR